MFVNRTLFDLTKGIRGRLFKKVLIGLFEAFTYLVQIYSLSEIVRMIYAKEELASMSKFFVFIVLGICVRSAVNWWDSYYGKKIIGDVKNILRQRCYQKILCLGPGYLTDERTGQIEANIVAGVDYLEEYLVQYLPAVVVTIITGIAYTAYVFTIHPVLAMMILCSYIVAIISPVAFGRPFSDASKEHWETYGELKADLLDAVQGMDTLKAYGIGEKMGKELDGRMKKLTITTMRNLKINITEVGIANFAMGIGGSFTLAIAAYFVAKGTIGVQHLTILLFFVAEIFRPIQMLQGYWHNAFMGYTASKSIYDMLETEESIVDEGQEVLPDDGISIAFEDVCFGYKEKEPLFEHLNLTIGKGERIALVGESGSGKSTIFSLLMRFYNLDSGVIKCNGRDSREYRLDSLRESISLVSQDTYLFHGTIRDNIAMAKKDADEEEIQRAAKIASIHDFIMSLENGYDTLVGERGVNFSGGQRQRISIARAVLKNSPILLLDEATSSVDKENEREIQHALDVLMKEKTTITIAHRLSTIENAGMIYVLEGGKIVERGTHSELSAKKGAYFHLLKKQMFDNDIPSGKRVEHDVYRDEAEKNTVYCERENIGDSCDGVSRKIGGGTSNDATNRNEEAENSARIEKYGRGTILKYMTIFLQGVKPRFIRTIFEGFMDKVLGLGTALFGAYIVARVLGGNATYFEWYLPVLFVMIALRGFFSYLEMYEAHYVAYKILEVIRGMVYRAVYLGAPYSTTKNRSGRLSSIILQDVELLEGFYAHSIGFSIYTMLFMMVVLVPLFILFPLLGVLVVLVSVMIFVVPFFLRTWGEKIGEELREKVSHVNAEVVDSVQGLREILLFRNSDDVVQNIMDETMALNLLERKEGVRMGVQRALINVFLSLTIVFCALICHSMVVSGMNPLYVPVLLILSANVYGPVRGLSTIGMKQAVIRESMSRVKSILDIPSNEDVEERSLPEGNKFPDGNMTKNSVLEDGSEEAMKGSVEEVLTFQNVSFGYEKDFEVLSDLSFSLKRGEKLSISGPSGVGKTTLALLATRFYRPSRGKIFLNGRDINTLSRENIADIISYIPQETYLFNKSIMENIKMVGEDVSDEDVYRASKLAMADKFIRDMPDGYNTVVGERGARLSGGEKQRIAVARALIKNSPILIMDEATSSLDSENEAAFVEKVSSLEGKSIIIIAHRESTLRIGTRRMNLG